MATREWPMLNQSMTPDDSGNVWAAPISTELTLTNASAGKAIAIVLPAAATIAADTGIYGSFVVPNDYVGSPVCVIKAILDGAPSTLVIAFGLQLGARADNEAWDAALGTENIASASSVSHVDEDVYVETITIADTLAAGDVVNFFFYIDDSVHTYTGKVLLMDLIFQYSDA